jgi:hypothetical protein
MMYGPVVYNYMTEFFNAKTHKVESLFSWGEKDQRSQRLSHGYKPRDHNTRKRSCSELTVTIPIREKFCKISPMVMPSEKKQLEKRINDAAMLRLMLRQQEVNPETESEVIKRFDEECDWCSNGNFIKFVNENAVIQGIEMETTFAAWNDPRVTGAFDKFFPGDHPRRNANGKSTYIIITRTK